jgi:hypothetical protein
MIQTMTAIILLPPSAAFMRLFGRIMSFFFSAADCGQTILGQSAPSLFT